MAGGRAVKRRRTRRRHGLFGRSGGVLGSCRRILLGKGARGKASSTREGGSEAWMRLQQAAAHGSKLEQGGDRPGDLVRERRLAPLCG